MKKKIVKKEKDNFDIMCREIAKYIEFHGGKAVIMGGISVMEKGKFKFGFIVDFVGKPPKKILQANK